MKKLKQILFYILTIAVLLVSTDKILFAENKENSFYFLSKENVVHDEYAKQNIYRFVSDSKDNHLFRNFKLGKGIKILNDEKQERTLYPIYLNDKIVATFLVATVEEEVGGIYSIAYSERLNEIKELTSKDKPLVLKSFDEDLWGIIENKAYSLNKNLYKEIEEYRNEIGLVLNDNKLHLTYKQNIISERNPSGHVLGFKIKYTQPDCKKRCYSYALANILYNLGYDWHTPDTISKYFNYASGLSFKRLSKYLDKYNFSNVATDSGYLGKDSVIEQIYYKGRYILVGGTNQSTGSEHAFVIFGYSRSNNTYSFWNPWYNFTQKMDRDTRLMNTSDSRVYKWDAGYIKDIGKKR